MIFNATPVGMGADKHTPLEEHELNALWVFDSVYNPIETRLLKLAQSKGCGTISGAEMFVHQAARQFEIWTGKPAPIDAMRQVLLRQLGAVGAENAAPIPMVVPPKNRNLAANTISDAADTSAEAPAKAEASAATTANPVTESAPKTVEKASAKAAAKKVAPAKAAPAKAAAVKAAPAKAAPVKVGKAAVKVAAKTARKVPAKPAAKKR